MPVHDAAVVHVLLKWQLLYSLQTDSGKPCTDHAYIDFVASLFSRSCKRWYKRL